MTRPEKVSCKSVYISRVVWQVSPSCWNRMSLRAIPSKLNKKNCVIIYNIRHLVLMHYMPRFQRKMANDSPDHNAHQTVTSFGRIFWTIINFTNRYNHIFLFSFLPRKRTFLSSPDNNWFLYPLITAGFYYSSNNRWFPFLCRQHLYFYSGNGCV